MASFVYFICFVSMMAYFVNQWTKARNKLPSIIGMIFAVLPYINLILTIVVVVKNWTQIKAWFDKTFA